MASPAESGTERVFVSAAVPTAVVTKKEVVFLIDVTGFKCESRESHGWKVNRSYREFSALHEKLERDSKEMSVVRFPHLRRKKFKAAALCHQFEVYTNQLLGLKILSTSELLYEFFALDQLPSHVPWYLQAKKPFLFVSGAQMLQELEKATEDQLTFAVKKQENVVAMAKDSLDKAKTERTSIDGLAALERHLEESKMVLEALQSSMKEWSDPATVGPSNMPKAGTSFVKASWQTRRRNTGDQRKSFLMKRNRGGGGTSFLRGGRGLGSPLTRAPDPTGAQGHADEKAVRGDGDEVVRANDAKWSSGNDAAAAVRGAARQKPKRPVHRPPVPRSVSPPRRNTSGGGEKSEAEAAPVSLRMYSLTGPPARPTRRTPVSEKNVLAGGNEKGEGGREEVHTGEDATVDGVKAGDEADSAYEGGSLPGGDAEAASAESVDEQGGDAASENLMDGSKDVPRAEQEQLGCNGEQEERGGDVGELGREQLDEDASISQDSMTLTATPIIALTADELEEEEAGPAVSTARGGTKARALFDCDGDPDPASLELSFRADDVITIVDTDESGWWQGELHSEKGMSRGWFPSNYVSVLEEDVEFDISDLSDISDDDLSDGEEDEDEMVAMDAQRVTKLIRFSCMLQKTEESAAGGAQGEFGEDDLARALAYDPAKHGSWDQYMAGQT